jgi:hypothetical protein
MRALVMRVTPSSARKPLRRRFVIAVLLATCASALGAASAQAAPPPIITERPEIIGSAVEGETLTGTTGSWIGNDLTFSYRWQRSAGVGYADITGADGNTYVLTAADIGHTIRLRVTATNSHDETTTAESDPTDPVVPAPELSLFVSRRPEAYRRATIRAEGFADSPLKLWVYESFRGKACPDTPAEPIPRHQRLIVGTQVDGDFNEQRRPRMRKPGRHSYCAYMGPNEANADVTSSTTRKVRKPLLKAPRAHGSVETAIERHGFADRVANNLQKSCSRRSRSEFECTFTSAFPGYFLQGSGSVELTRNLSYRFRVTVRGRSFVLTDENEGRLPG